MSPSSGGVANMTNHPNRIEVKTYQDDGYSGGNFQRPGFLEMLEDARHGLILFFWYNKKRDFAMNELLEWMEYIEDNRQQTKVRHKLKDIIVIVLFATLANVDDWVEMEYFAHYHEEYLKKYIELKNGIIISVV